MSRAVPPGIPSDVRNLRKFLNDYQEFFRSFSGISTRVPLEISQKSKFIYSTELLPLLTIVKVSCDKYDIQNSYPLHGDRGISRVTPDETSEGTPRGIPEETPGGICAETLKGIHVLTIRGFSEEKKTYRNF